ncbi:MAG: hypothetical protein KC478_13155 [Bacteriovoracaceae bacterium]|nr:hypothetical protein [Bacteriovoracaceae bacterium]
MNKHRKTYALKKNIYVNGLLVAGIIIDPHVGKQEDQITDELITSLVMLLDGKSFAPTAERGEFSYFLSRVLFETKVYRLVWLQERNQFYVGVITAFKEKGATHDVP